MRNLLVIISLFLVIFAMVCTSPAGASEDLVIVGTGSGVPLLNSVAKAFSDQNPGIAVIIPDSIGSGGGIKAVGQGKYVLGRVARDIQRKEKHYGLKLVPLAKIPIVFFVNSNVTLTGITYEQACAIYDGTFRKWEELNGGQGKIRVIKREVGDSSLIVLLETLPGFKDITLTDRSKTTYTDLETVEECKEQKNAIAFGSWSDIKNEKGVRVLELGGLHPSDPAYPHIGPLSLVYKKKNYKGVVKTFLEFISSSAAQRAIIDAGGYPVK